MSQKAKYLQVAKITWKSMVAYQTDTWLGAAVSGFRVLLAFLLWQAIFAGRSEVAGFTLPMMVTYYLVTGLLGRLQHQDDLAWQLANEVRQGQFSKYLVRPMPVAGFFLGAGVGRWIFLLLVNAGALLAWAGVFSRWVVLPPNPINLIWMAALLPLGALVMLLLNHDIALLSLRYQDITGFMILKGSIIEFLSGVMVPLSLFPGGVVSALQLTPFYYVVYYPATLFLGTQTTPPWVAVLVLCGWCLALFAAGQAWFIRARKYYEGVGI